MFQNDAVAHFSQIVTENTDNVVKIINIHGNIIMLESLFNIQL